MTDTTLIQRLRDGTFYAVAALMNEAADALEQQAADLAYVKAASVFNLMEENKRQAAQIEALRADAERLRASAEKVILFNRDHANDQYGDPNKAEAWACVRELRAALRQEQPT